MIQNISWKTITASHYENSALDLDLRYGAISGGWQVFHLGIYLGSEPNLGAAKLKAAEHMKTLKLRYIIVDDLPSYTVGDTEGNADYE